jgi:hypothetical protein
MPIESQFSHYCAGSTHKPLLLKVGLSEFDLRTTGDPEPAAPCPTGWSPPKHNGRSQTSATQATAIQCGSRTSTQDMTRITQVRGVDGSKPFGFAPFVEVVPIRVATSLASLGRSASTKFFCRWPAR